MTNDRLGRTIIDKLTLCYKAGSPLLSVLREVNSRTEFDKFQFYRTIHEKYAHHFDVMLNGEKVMTACFEKHTNRDEPYLWITLENYVFYNRELMVEVLKISELLDLDFNNITHLELARDFKYNISERIRTLMRNPKLKTIINGKKVKDRKESLVGLHRTCEMCLDKDFPKSLTVKQAKTINNKYNGTMLDSYNKYNEIMHKSNKYYILDYYGNPSKLYRLEVRLNNADIRKLSKMCKIELSEDIIFDEHRLDKLYLRALHSLLRFTHSRKKLDWQILFECNVRYK